jgi:acetyltransferase
MMEQTKIYTALKGVRGRDPVDLAQLEQLLVRFSQLVMEQRWVQEIDINPLLVSSTQLVALDARIVLHPPDTDLATVPRPAIRPYPIQYVSPWTLKDGKTVTIRPIRPEDEPLIVKFHETLSEESVYLRYFHLMKLQARVAHDRLIRICFIDYDREMALVAEYQDPQTGECEILGVCRGSKQHGINEGEFAMLVNDRWQNQGLGTELLKRLLAVGRDEKLDRVTADILPQNRSMQHICQKLGFEIRRGMDVVSASYEYPGRVC